MQEKSAGLARYYEVIDAANFVGNVFPFLRYMMTIFPRGPSLNIRSFSVNANNSPRMYIHMNAISVASITVTNTPPKAR